MVKSKSYMVTVSINKFFNLGGDMSSSYSQFVMVEGLAQNEATRLAEKLNLGYKKFWSQNPETEARTYTADFWSNRTTLGYGDVRRKYSAEENKKVKVKLPQERKKVIANLESRMADGELFGLMGRESYFYEKFLGGYCKYHGA